jgi:hypothetical protein
MLLSVLLMKRFILQIHLMRLQVCLAKKMSRYVFKICYYYWVI